MVAYNFPHNVINEGSHIINCEGQYCSQLPVPVFPTAFYETIICSLLFLFLWSLRYKLIVPGTMFAIYLIVNGIERFCIEKIRVNTKYNIFGWHPTQAEIISALLVFTGIALFYFFKRKQSPKS
jgi:prolipoprotein diacylglyceryltransferase